MTNIEPDDFNEPDKDFPSSSEDNPNRQFPHDDSNTGDNPIIPDKEDQIPVGDNDPSDVDDDNKPSQSTVNSSSEKVGSDKGGVQPYNINSNTSDNADNEDQNGIEPKQGPIDTNEDQDFENTDQDSENSHM